MTDGHLDLAVDFRSNLEITVVYHRTVWLGVVVTVDTLFLLAVGSKILL